MTAPSAARALTRAEFADLADEAARLAREVGYWDATHGALGQRRVAARDETDAHAALMAAYDALTARAEAAESALALWDWLAARLPPGSCIEIARVGGGCTVHLTAPGGVTQTVAVYDATTPREAVAAVACAAPRSNTPRSDAQLAAIESRRQRAEAVIGTAGLWPETPLPDDAMRAGDGA